VPSGVVTFAHLRSPVTTSSASHCFYSEGEEVSLLRDQQVEKGGKG